EVGHDPVQHRHPHADAGLPRAFLVGLMHGMAGSAALVLLAPGPLHSFTTGLEYLLVFGLGSTLGMGLISVVISLPLRFASHTLTSYYHLLQGLIGGGTVAMGGWMLLTLFPRLLN
ncbi:MAG: hypothetical protein OEW39_03835, partial [Deltaproteobacteria bacterium]|nr:hypothetical protein [Deltaproteobacteria bacterium]